MKKINISITGANGKMGKILTKKIIKDKRFNLFSLTDLDTTKKIEGVRVQKNSLEAFKKVDIIIDFSRPKSTIQVLKLATTLKKKIVIGTTGFNKEQENQIKNYSKKISIFKSGNMSLIITWKFF